MLRFGMHTDSICLLRKGTDETIQHILQDWPVSLANLNSSPTPLSPNWVRDINGMTSSIKHQVLFLFIGGGCSLYLVGKK